MAAVEIHDLHKSFASRQGTISVLNGATARIESGTFAALCGPSGCGKSTLLLILGALLLPDAGRVSLAGEELLAMTHRIGGQYRAKLVGFVFQKFHLLPYLTVAENIHAATVALPAEGPAGHRAEELMERLQLTHRREHLPEQLSVGEQQRTAMARALYNRPKILLADEPTGNLDPENARVVLSALAEFATTGGTVVMVTHNPLAAERADKRWLLREGTLVEAT